MGEEGGEGEEGENWGRRKSREKKIKKRNKTPINAHIYLYMYQRRWDTMLLLCNYHMT